jgi:hypothetical protein
LFSVKVTEKPPSGTGTAMAHGVLQPGPKVVRASAPDGTDSSWSCTIGGAGFKASQENEEHPVRQAPATAIAMTRRMINPSLLLRLAATIPGIDHKSVGTAAQPCGPASLING